MRAVIIKNVSGSDSTYSGQMIPDTESYTLTVHDLENRTFDHSDPLFVDVGTGDAVINDGTDDITDVTEKDLL